MKKKVVAAMLVMCMAVSAYRMWKSDSDPRRNLKPRQTDSGDKKETDSQIKKEEVRIVSVNDVSDYVTIGDYKGLTLDRYTQAVTDDDVQAEIKL